MIIDNASDFKLSFDDSIIVFDYSVIKSSFTWGITLYQDGAIWVLFYKMINGFDDRFHYFNQISIVRNCCIAPEFGFKDVVH
jgi:hypothetical protein